MDGSETPESIIRPYLGAGEKLLWKGQPAQGMRFSSQDLFLVPFSLLWGGFAIFWNFMVWTHTPNTGDAGTFKLFGLPFLVLGLYFIAGRFVADAWVRSRTVYGLTDTRAIVVRRVWSEQLLTSPLDHAVKLTRRGQGGDVEFGVQPSPWGRSNGFSMWMPAMGGSVAFLGIADAMAVYQLAQKRADR
ncbi:MAG TPA: hypothetical protein VGM25_05000 [Caulobacteraceae bacterium]|jgi:hypothetical protein